MSKTKNEIAFVGLGYSELTAKPVMAENDLIAHACRLAAEDAGIDLSEVDGINLQSHHYPPPDTAALRKAASDAMADPELIAALAKRSLPFSPLPWRTQQEIMDRTVSTSVDLVK